MDQFNTAQPAAQTADTLLQKVLTDARVIFGDRATEAELDSLVKSAVHDLYGDSIRVSTFVPLLAIRQVRESLDAGTIIAG